MQHSVFEMKTYSVSNSTSITEVSSWLNPEDLNPLEPNETSYLFINLTDISTPNPLQNRTRSGHATSKYAPFLATLMVSSCLCLILSLVVYCVIPEFRNLHGKNLITLSSCMLVNFLFRTFGFVFRNYISFTFCFAVSVIVHFTILASCFWTNVMAFDIWQTITLMKPRSLRRKGRGRYLKYSCYAWTATVLTSLPAVILESTDWISDEFKPKFAVNRCWLNGIKAFAYYYYLPVGVTLFENLVMFLLTIWKLRIVKKMNEKLDVKQHQNRLNLYLKLFLVMGVIWFSGFLPWVTGIHALFPLVGILRSLHGVLLFMIFVCKKRIFRQVSERLRVNKVTDIHLQNSSIQKADNAVIPQNSSSTEMSSM